MIRTQREADCGVCAVANALGVSWEDAAGLIFGPRWWNRLRFNTKTRQIAKALQLTDHKLIRVSSWGEIPNRSVVKVIPAECEGTGNWHWVAWRNNKVWDSNNNTPLSPALYNGGRRTSYLGERQ